MPIERRVVSYPLPWYDVVPHSSPELGSGASGRKLEPPTEVGGIVSEDITTMAARCDICGKGTTFGRNIRHKSTGRWQRKASRTNRTFRPNLHEQTIWRDGHRVTLTLCTRCLRTGLKTAGAPVQGVKVSTTKPGS